MTNRLNYTSDVSLIRTSVKLWTMSIGKHPRMNLEMAKDEVITKEFSFPVITVRNIKFPGAKNCHEPQNIIVLNVRPALYIPLMTFHPNFSKQREIAL